MHGTRNRLLFIALCAALAGACTAAGGGGGGGGEGEGDGSDPFGKGDYIARCDASSNPMLRCYGQTRFHSIAPVWDFLPMRALEGAATNARAAGGEVTRTVEESDIYRHDAERHLLYVLNAYRGLQVLGVADPDHPEFLGATSLGGYPVEMYQEGNYAFVLLNAFEGGGDEEPTDYGARVRVLDMSDPMSPVQVGDDFRLEGSITGSRLLPARDASGNLVSQILYVASEAYTREPNQDVATWQPHSYIKSIDLTNPSMPAEVDHVDFRGTGHAMHVTPEAIFVASTDWSVERATTNVQYVDIESLEGDIVLGGMIGIDGTVNWGESGELQLDHFRGHLRVASQISGRDEMGNWTTHIRMTTIATADHANLEQVDAFDFATGHSILATRFSGDVAYLFHATQVDPLEIIDLRDPRDVRSLGILPIEGFVNRIDVRGKHLIALGNVQNAEGTGTRNLAMHVFDVEDPTMPRQLGVTTVGEGWAWTSSNWDLKSYRIVDDLGLVLMPVSESHTDESGRWTYRQFLQLVSFDFEACDSGDRANCIRARGSIDGHGEVRRAFPVNDRIVSFSDLQLQVADVSNPDMPALTTTVELAVDIHDFRVVNGAGVMIVGKGDWNSRSAELRVVDAARPDERRATATLQLNTPTGTVHTIGTDKILIVASDTTSDVVDGQPRWQSWTVLTVVDLSNPARPTIAAQNRIPELGFNRWSRRIWMPAPGPSYAVAQGALVAFTWPREGEAEGGKLRVYDVGSATETKVLDIGAETVVDMTAVGSTMYITSYEPVMTPTPPMDTAMLPAGSNDAQADDASAATLLPGSRIWPGRRRNQTVLYKLRVVDLALPSTPTVSEPVNVPGVFAGTMRHRDGRNILFTTDMFMHEMAAVTAFDAMTLSTAQVSLDDVFGTPEGAGRVIVQDNRAFFVKNTYGWSGPVPLGDEAAIDRRAPSSTLYALSIAQNTARPTGTYRPAVTIRRLGEADLGAGTFNELNLVQGNLAFIRGGYGNVLVYDVTYPRRGMTLLGDFRTSAGWWSGAMYFDGSRLFLANGLYGLDTISVR